ncbi:MAG: hypothetical protein ABSG41_09355 [Bryobacteraceae bacterium]|jgi:hypothetical protein
MSTNVTQPAAASPEPAQAGQTSPGRATERVNLILSGAALEILDGTAAKIRQDTGCRVNRSEVVRAMVEAFGESRLRFSGVRSERDMKNVWARHFKAIGRTVVMAEAQRTR